MGREGAASVSDYSSGVRDGPPEARERPPPTGMAHRMRLLARRIEGLREAPGGGAWGEGVGRAVDEALREAPPRGAASHRPTSAPRASGLELHPAQTMMLLGQLCKVSGAGAGAHLLGWLRVRSGDPGIPDVRMYTKVIGHCARERDAVLALELLHTLERQGLQPDLEVLNAVANACGRAGRAAEAEAILGRLRRGPAPLRPNVNSFAAVVGAYARVGDAEAARRVFGEMASSRVRPNRFVYCALITALGRAGRWREALEELQRMEQEGPSPDAAAFNATIDALGRGGQWERAWAVFSQMRHQGVEHRVDSYNALIMACQRSGAWERALEVFQRLRSLRGYGLRPLRPDAYTFNAALAACARGRCRERAEKIFAEMQRFGARPSVHTYCSMVEACSDHPEVALEWYAAIGAAGLRPDALAEAARARVLARHFRAPEALEVLRAGSPTGVGGGPDGGTCVLVAEALQEEGASAQVLEMWQLVQDWRLPPRDRVRIARAAVDAFEQLGEWDAACATFEEAQRLEASADLSSAARSLLYSSPHIMPRVPKPLVSAARAAIDSGRAARSLISKPPPPDKDKAQEEPAPRAPPDAAEGGTRS